MKKLVVLLLILTLQPVFAQQTVKPDSFSFHTHIPLAAVPTSPANALVPNYGPLAGVTPPAGVTVTSAFFVNTNAATTVTVTATCITGGLVFVEAALQGVNSGANNLTLQFGADGVYCPGGVSWSASGTGVNGTMSARY